MNILSGHGTFDPESLWTFNKNQPNDKYWKCIAWVQKKALKVNSIHSSVITSFILLCAIPAMLKHSRERGRFLPGLHPKLSNRIKVDFPPPLQAIAYFSSLLVLILSWIHILFSRYSVEGRWISPYHFPRLGWRGHWLLNGNLLSREVTEKAKSWETGLRNYLWA